LDSSVPIHSPREYNPARRRFLQTSFAGVLILASSSFFVRRPLADTVAATNPYAWLEDQDVLIVRRVAPVLLSGALPDGKAREQALDEIVYGFDLAVSYFPPSVRGEIRQLFDLLRNSITRFLLAGMLSSWENATPAQVEHLLKRWEHSRLRLLRSAYAALHDLVAGAWYGNPRSWPRIGYPGPPVLK
jgi:hypothetical protein